jgi:hypothetical protein
VNPVTPHDYYVNRAMNKFIVFAGRVVNDELVSQPHELFVVGQLFSDVVRLEFSIRLQ